MSRKRRHAATLVRALLISTFALLAASAVAVPGAPAAARAAQAPDPVTCQGYAENRVYLENQSWWEAQPGPADHPGTGKQGHIHVGTCFPLWQRLTGPTLPLDLTLQLHN